MTSQLSESVDSAEHAEVLSYFRDKADGYDRVDEQVYWRLSDELLWESIERHVLPNLPQGGRLLDAGGGTGRWTDRLLTARPDLTGVLYDLSPDMSRHATAKAEQHGYQDRLTVVNGDLMNVAEDLAGHSFDLVISFHNVLGFVAEPTEVLRQLSSLMNPGAQMALVLPNRYHTAFFNIMVGNLDEARSAVLDRTGRFTPDMPAMHLFTPTELQGDLARVGLHTTVRTGYPVLVYPGYQETQLDGSSAGVLRTLSDPEHYRQIRELELSLLGESALAERGNNLFFVAKRGA
ncbi:methyltransferase domain-containing protein [Streptacidiphilus sp. PB12-B1b]|uniref:class I SAM-dependent methyltransferase n=1 Tax=Streptacidiphilus sp. PB12-B1b TaxID=2705012 RepID=UPI0015F866A9|nr:methyltransferase domain-containing protein [Streptacidiphilus sp. PB12-B1b]QMU75413.1 methyltransferase domain-containing protein [Streptacidiphilus sp. PB12-B1b]